VRIVIYKLTSPSGKVYIGQTVNLCKRLNEHNRTDSPIGYALRKYGLENFDVEVLWLAADEEMAGCLESCAIRVYESKVPNGYNRTDGGEGCRGYHHTEEFKRKVSKRMMGNEVWKLSPVVGKPNMLGKTHRESTRRKISQALVGNENNLHSPGFSGYSHSEETKDRIRKKLQGRMVSDSTRKKMSGARRRYWQNRKGEEK